MGPLITRLYIFNSYFEDLSHPPPTHLNYISKAVEGQLVLFNLTPQGHVPIMCVLISCIHISVGVCMCVCVCVSSVSLSLFYVCIT